MTARSNAQPTHILLVEDNPGDVRLTQEAFREADIEVTIDVATDGKQALTFLRERQASTADPYPDLVLLDLNLPRKGGFEVLNAIREGSEFPYLPVLILSSSTTPEDIIESYERSANAYLTKPNDPDEFVTLARAVNEFWIGQVELPSVS